MTPEHHEPVPGFYYTEKWEKRICSARTGKQDFLVFIQKLLYFCNKPVLFVLWIWRPYLSSKFQVYTMHDFFSGGTFLLQKIKFTWYHLLILTEILQVSCNLKWHIDECNVAPFQCKIRIISNHYIFNHDQDHILPFPWFFFEVFSAHKSYNIFTCLFTVSAYWWVTSLSISISTVVAHQHTICAHLSRHPTQE